MTTKKPSKGGSTSRSQAPKKGAKAGAARTTKPGKPLPGWFPELNESGAPPRGRKVRSADAPGPAPGRKLPPTGKVGFLGDEQAGSRLHARAERLRLRNLPGVQPVVDLFELRGQLKLETGLVD